MRLEIENSLPLPRLQKVKRKNFQKNGRGRRVGTVPAGRRPPLPQAIEKK